MQKALHTKTVDVGEAMINKKRFVRFSLWAMAMCATCSIVALYNPHKAVFVPCIFIAIMVPAVMIPGQPSSKQLSNPKDAESERPIVNPDPRGSL